MANEERKLTEEEFDATTQSISRDASILKLRVEASYNEAIRLGSLMNDLTTGVETDPYLLKKLVEFTTRPDMTELKRLTMALMYAKNPAGSLIENILPNDDSKSKM